MQIRDELRRLVDLQVAELELRDLKRTLAGLPAEREQCKQASADARAAVAEVQARHEKCLKTHRQLEGELQDAEGQLDKYREHELQVKTNEQLWALQDEMHQVQERIDAIEEHILEQMERADVLASQIAQRDSDLQEVERQVQQQLQAIDARQHELEARRTQIQDLVRTLSAEVPRDLLDLYERVKAVRAGVGMAEALDGTCLACNFRLRPQLYLEVINMEAPLQCDNCKRILFNREALELPAELHIAGE